MRYAGSNAFASAYKNMLQDVPDYTGLSTIGMDAASSERQQDTFSQAQVEGAGLNSMEIVKSAAHLARGIKAGGMAQAAATRASGMSSMIGGIAGGIGSLNFGGGTDYSAPGAGWGS